MSTARSEAPLASCYDGAVDAAPRTRRSPAPCPRCGATTAWQGNPQRPFCSLTCRLLDLGDWLDERHRIAGPEHLAESAPGELGPGQSS